MKEPVTVQEIWQIRRKIAQEAQNDVGKYLSLVEKEFNQLRKEYRVAVPEKRKQPTQK